VAFAKLYDRKTPLVAADLLNDRVIPFFDEQQIPLCRVLTDRGPEFGKRGTKYIGWGERPSRPNVVSGGDR